MHDVAINGRKGFVLKSGVPLRRWARRAKRTYGDVRLEMMGWMNPGVIQPGGNAYVAGTYAFEEPVD